MNSSKLAGYIAKSLNVRQALLDDKSLQSAVLELAIDTSATLKSGKKVIFAGNGGSMSDAMHLAAEFVVKYKSERRPLPAIALATNQATLTAVGNDFSFEDIFSREIEALAVPGDLFIPITTSGNSENIIRAVDAAIAKGVTVIGLTGQSGGSLAKKTPCVRVPSIETAFIQEAHILIGHFLCEYVEQELLRGV